MPIQCLVVLIKSYTVDLSYCITLHSSLLTLSSMVLFSGFQYISRQMGSCYILLQGNVAYGTQCITQGSDEEHR